MKTIEYQASDILAILEDARQGKGFPLNVLQIGFLLDLAQGNHIVIKSFDASETEITSIEQMEAYFTLLGYPPKGKGPAR